MIAQLANLNVTNKMIFKKLLQHFNKYKSQVKKEKKKKKKHKKLKNLVEKIKWIKKKNSKFPIILLLSKRTQTKRNRLAKIALKMKWIKISTILLYMQYPHNPTLKWNELKKIIWYLPLTHWWKMLIWLSDCTIGKLECDW